MALWFPGSADPGRIPCYCGWPAITRLYFESTEAHYSASTDLALKSPDLPLWDSRNPKSSDRSSKIQWWDFVLGSYFSVGALFVDLTSFTVDHFWRLDFCWTSTARSSSLCDKHFHLFGLYFRFALGTTRYICGGQCLPFLSWRPSVLECHLHPICDTKHASCQGTCLS